MAPNCEETNSPAATVGETRQPYVPYALVSENGSTLPVYDAAIQQGSLTFYHFVHLIWGMTAHEVAPPVRRLCEIYYRRILNLFEQVHGTVTLIHVCSSEPSAVALVSKPESGARRRVDLHLEYCLKGVPENQELFVECERLKVESEQYLTGADREHCLGFLYTVCRGILCLVDCKNPTDRQGLREAIVGQIRGARALHARFARRRAQELYVRSAFWGFGTTVALLGVSLLLLAPMRGGEDARLWSMSVEKLFGANVAAIAGAFGALISVISRVRSGTMQCRYKLERTLLIYMGALRPVIGAVFAVVLFMIIQSGVISVSFAGRTAVTISLIVVLGFVAGFSERLVSDMLLVTERGMREATGGPLPGATTGRAQADSSHDHPLGLPPSNGGPSTSARAANDGAVPAQARG